MYRSHLRLAGEVTVSNNIFVCHPNMSNRISRVADGGSDWLCGCGFSDLCLWRGVTEREPQG